MRCLLTFAMLILCPLATAFGQGNPGSNQPALSRFTLVVTGNGAVAPDLNNRLLRVGARYTITARPATGFVFSNWTGAVVSDSPKLSFVMQSNLVLHANFIPNPFLPAKGNYAGLFYEADGVTFENSGFLALTLTDRGSFSGRVHAAGKPYSLKGQFSVAGAFSNSIPRRGLSALSVQLQLDLARGDQLMGLVSDGSFTAQLSANRAAYSKLTNPAPQGGKRFTLVIPPAGDSPQQPGGNGFGSVTVDLAGNLKFSATLGDGTKASQATFLTKTGAWPFFASLYGGRGSILGELVFATELESDLGGPLSWFKLPQPGVAMYPAGFALTNGPEAVGSAYAFTRGVPLLALTNGGLVALEGGHLAQMFTNAFQLDANNRAKGPNKLSASITPATGLFRGKVTNPGMGRPVSFKGTLLQKQNAGFGHFVITDQSGRVYFGPPVSPPDPPPPPPPVANFNASPTRGQPPLTVSFANLSQHATNYSWTFGDGAQSALEQPTHVYANAGTFSVSLTVVGTGGTDVVARADYIVVTNAPPPPPVASFNGSPTTGEAPLAVVFANLSQRATNYSWSFGDGTQSALEQPTHIYTHAGTYSVSLTVVGAGGTAVLARADYIVVTNASPPPPPPPVASFNASPTTGEAPLTVAFANLSQRATNYSWSFGDDTQSSLEQPTHVYANAGTYSVSLTVVGAGGTDVLTRTDYIVVTNAAPLPPVASFNGSPTTGEAPLTVVFANLSQHTTNYSWSFGDGTQSALEQPTHIYTNAGTYSVSLAVVGVGGTDVLTRAGYIVVTNAPPGVTNLPSRVLNLANWKLTLPVDTPHAGVPDEIKQPELDGFQDTNYFRANQSRDGVVFTAHCGGYTTSGSGYPRSELREMTGNGSANASWSTTSGTHTMEITEAITHLPVVKPHVVAGQIHDAIDDVIVFRLEGSSLFVDENGNRGPVLNANYQLGEKFTVKFVAQNGGVEVYYNNQYIYTYPVNTSGCYFKAGCYTQSNTSRGDDATAYGQVVIYKLSVTHQ